MLIKKSVLCLYFRIKNKQLEDIFKLMQNKQDKLGMSMDEIRGQLESLYTVKHK